jgi:DNA mismatch endonuclease, patch repair protein
LLLVRSVLARSYGATSCPKHATQPKTNAAFWRDKIARNKARDRHVNVAMRKRGWKVLRIWQHELTKRNEPRLLAKLRFWL